ncbi:beta-Ig-H3/fasciclin [Chlorogloeopsis sp. ULAP02]|uniref:beta-Ig-H3/fasciclin n=1 Tax=Chlorogloeopsis sp. ULAP02 TaxID=3107926 RepID=UPI0031365732
MNKKFVFLASAVGLSLLIGACEPAAETPTTTPPAGTTPVPPAGTTPGTTPPATPTTP